MFITKVLIVPTLVVILIANGAAANIAALIAAANTYGAPFAGKALNRLEGSIFGSGRATRSTDIIIFNKSSKTFKLKANFCTHGGFTTDLFPVDEIQAKESTVFGIESHGLRTGCECSVKYVSADGTFFDAWTANPYIGDNQMNQDQAANLRITATLGKGNNNQVRVIVEDK